MGFHKRWLSESKLRSIYESSGLQGLRTTLRADAFICEDDFSSTFLDIADERVDEIFEQKIKDHFNVPRITS
jgi:hypothetical protein